MQMRVLVVAVAMMLAACQNMSNQQTGGLLGGAGGGALGGLLGSQFGSGSGKTVATAVGALGGAVAGYFVGSAIGQKLDQADQKKAAATTQKVLTEPVHKDSSGQLVAKQHSWSDSQKGTKGTSEVTEVQKQPDGGECRTVKEVAYIHGDEVSQDTKYCKDATGNWQASAI